MKKIFCNIFALSLTLAGASCSYTDLTPTDIVDDSKVFSSVSSLEQTVNGAYDMMSMRTTVSVSAVLSDDVVKGGQNGGAGDDSFQWTYTEHSGDHNNLWAAFYGNVSAANRILQGASGIACENEREEAVKKDCVGTALFMRAYSHFELLRFFADFDKKESWGVPYSTSPVLLESLGRNSVQECYDGIVEDLKECLPMLSENKSNCYVTPLAVKALLARVHFYAGDNAQAYAYAKEVVEAKPIASLEVYPKIWTDESNEEVIFKLRKMAGEETIGDVFFWADNSSLFEPSEELQEIYEAGDVRKSCFFAKGVDRENVKVDRVVKYMGSKDNVGLVDQKVLRSSEMLLIMAEAKANMGEVSVASDCLNELKAARIEGWSPKVYASADEVLDEVLEERRRELCYEGHRFFDLRRRHLPISKPSINKVLAADDYHRLMPIPLSERQGNKVIDEQQNPGY